MMTRKGAHGWPSVRMALTLALFVAACRPAAEPSEEYERAFSLWMAVQETSPQAPGEDSRADEALALAKSVSPRSLDADAARELAKRIESAKREAAESRVRRDALQAREPPPAPAESPSVARPEPTPSRAVATVGMPETELNELYDGCLKFAQPFVEARGAREGRAFGLVSSADCRARHPELVDNLVFVLEGKVFNVAPLKSAIPVVKTESGWAPENGQWPEKPNPDELDARPDPEPL